MPRTVSITQSPSFPVIQGAYEWFFAVERHDGEVLLRVDRSYSSADIPYDILFAPASQIELPTEPPVEEWLKFQNLVRVWRSERRAMPWITEMAVCPAYQSIIAMGPIAIPFILAQLESEGDEPDHWFWALRVLTGANPVKDEERGNIVKMAEAWFSWGRTAGYAW